MEVPLSVLAPLYIAFAVKHFLGDFALQTPRMAKGKTAASGWAAPLIAHAGTHAAGTLAIALVFAPSLWWLGLVDLALHAAIDRGKAVATRGWTQAESRFWTAFGLDQTAHQLTHFAFVIALAVS